MNPHASVGDVGAVSSRPRRLLLSTSLVLLLAWSAAVPIFESPDEPHHWQYARHLHDERRLPVYGPDFVEANSPPLYYALIAPLAIHAPLPPTVAWFDAAGGLVLPFAPRFIHNAGDDFRRYWPIRLARILTALMSVATVWFCWQAGLHAGGSAVALVCASLVAFLPQFTFRGAAVSNDALVTTLSAATVLCIVKLLAEPFTWRTGCAAGLALSGAYLSKISAICLIAPVALAVWWSDRTALRERLIRLTGVLGLAGAIVLPWSARNVLLYGDPFASGAMPHAVGYLMSYRSLTSEYYWTTFPRVLCRSFVGVFGWMNVWLPEGYYWFFWILGAAGLAALLIQLATRRRPVRLPLVLATIVILNLGVVVHINRSFVQPQGRYMFVALPALALSIALGLGGLPRKAAAGLSVVLALLNGFILGRYLVPVYYPPLTPTLSNASVVLSPAYMLDLAPQADGAVRVSGGDPQIGFATNQDAASVGFLAFDLSGTTKDADVQGSIYFAAEGRPASEAQRVGFSWRADGRKRVIRVPLLAHPLWRGRITMVRIDPINTSVERNQGDLVRIENVRLVGNLSLAP